MLDPLKIRAFGEHKQARYLQEAESRRLIKASRMGQDTSFLRLAWRLGGWLVVLGQWMQAAGAHATDKSSTRQMRIGHEGAGFEE